jgi:hypothetical protein
MPSHRFSEPCSGPDCTFCGPLLTPEEAYDQAWKHYYASGQYIHDFGAHDAQPEPECPGCQWNERWLRDHQAMETTVVSNPPEPPDKESPF